MEKVISIAGKWWIDFLRDMPKDDNDDLFHNAMMKILSDRLESVPEEKITSFEIALNEICLKNPSWCIGVTYSPDSRP